MTPKEKANELIEKYKDYVHGYVGSSMLTNTEYPEHILKQAKDCALICVDEMIIQNGKYYLLNSTPILTEIYKKENVYLYEVQKEIQHYKSKLEYPN